MNRYLTAMLLIAVAGLPVLAAAGDDHPTLTAADQAYSAGHYETAAALYRRDAELGIVAAQVNLAFLYLDGTGVPQDVAEAAKWFTRAAEQGNSEAQQNLGALYRDGHGITQNSVEAAKWFRIAGADAEAANVESRLTPQQKAEVAKLVADWRARFNSPLRQ